MSNNKQQLSPSAALTLEELDVNYERHPAAVQLRNRERLEKYQGRKYAEPNEDLKSKIDKYSFRYGRKRPMNPKLEAADWRACDSEAEDEDDAPSTVSAVLYPNDLTVERRQGISAEQMLTPARPVPRGFACGDVRVTRVTGSGDKKVNGGSKDQESIISDAQAVPVVDNSSTVKRAVWSTSFSKKFFSVMKAGPACHEDWELIEEPEYEDEGWVIHDAGMHAHWRVIAMLGGCQ